MTESYYDIRHYQCEKWNFIAAVSHRANMSIGGVSPPGIGPKSMLFSDPKWGNGCLVGLIGVAGFTLLNALMLHFHWALPRLLGQCISTALLLGLVRLILNQIFD